MKRFLALFAALFIFMTIPAFAGSDSMGWNGPIAGSITNATAYHTFEMASAKTVGFFSLHAVTTGAGTVTITYELSNIPNAAAADYVASGATAIATAKAAGTAFYQWPVAGEKIFAKFIRLKLVATGAVVYTLYPNVQ